ncbi:amino acid ABC transporter permease [Streptomyces griseicoloratus]|nr:amino acid ABC transporter permease [Streptomyces griseicoloratus]
MRLNQAADAGGTASSGSGDRLKHAAKPWNRAAGTADDLRISTNNTRTTLTTAHVGMAGGLSGLASLAELQSVLTSWEERLGALRDECESLVPKLRTVGRELVEVDAGIAAKVGSVPVQQGGGAK